MFDTIDSVDSLKLAKRISNAALSLKKTVPVLLEINTSGEVQKHGFLPNQLDEIIECFNETNIKIEGLMTVGPKTTEEKKTRNSFIQLRKTRDSISELLNQPNLRELSMGMSGDYEIAAEEGSSVVRLGTALFGNRRTPDTPK
jgi:hypothetical protein